MKLHFFSIFGPSIVAGVVQDNVLNDSLPFEVQMVNQVHGTDILEVTELKNQEAGYDAMVSDRTGLKLMIKSADCLPVMLADESAGVIGAIHAGWRSLVADIIPRTVERMISMGASTERIRAGMGPSLGTCCSQFSDPKAEIPEKYHWAILENHHVDLLSIAHRQLAEVGISEDRVERMAVCTACSPEWFSWRRDQGPERMGTFIERISV